MCVNPDVARADLDVSCADVDSPHRNHLILDVANVVFECCGCCFKCCGC
jgi:hypothetical protein